MRRHTWPAAVCLTTIALGAAVMAQQPATLVLRSSERVSGELVDMGADFTMRVGGDDRHVAIADVVLIDFVGGGSGLPITELNAIPSSGHLTVLRQGQESFIGRLIDIGGNPMQLVFSTDQGERRVEASRIGRVYLRRPAEATAASNAAAEPPVGNRKTIVVPGNVQWIDTGLDVTRGQVVTFSGSGEIQLSRDSNDKAGIAGSLSGRHQVLAPIASDLAGALIGRIGEGRAFGIGNQTSLAMSASGSLYVGINDSNVRDNTGTFTVTVGW